ncbi:putative membrane protein [Rickettsia parkeri str. AT|nr:putative membrane protein [Rickettsia parkeri str. AT\
MSFKFLIITKFILQFIYPAIFINAIRYTIIIIMTRIDNKI